MNKKQITDVYRHPLLRNLNKYFRAKLRLLCQVLG